MLVYFDATLIGRQCQRIQFEVEGRLHASIVAA